MPHLNCPLNTVTSHTSLRSGGIFNCLPCGRFSISNFQSIFKFSNFQTLLLTLHIEYYNVLLVLFHFSWREMVMQQWEYNIFVFQEEIGCTTSKKKDENLLKIFNDLGEQGWEIIQFHAPLYAHREKYTLKVYCKRKKGWLFFLRSRAPTKSWRRFFIWEFINWDLIDNWNLKIDHSTPNTVRWGRIRILIFKDGCFIVASTASENTASKAHHYATHQKLKFNI